MTALAINAIRRPGRTAVRRRTLVLGLAALAVGLAAITVLALGLLPGLHVGFLLGGSGQGNGGKLSPFIARVNSMRVPIGVLGAACATVGAASGGVLLAVGHPHGARMLWRVASGALVIAAAPTVLS